MNEVKEYQMRYHFRASYKDKGATLKFFDDGKIGLVFPNNDNYLDWEERIITLLK